MCAVLEGGPLADKYKIAQFHLHWGKTADTGSEHRVNDKMYAAEVSPSQLATAHIHKKSKHTYISSQCTNSYVMLRFTAFSFSMYILHLSTPTNSSN